jgi:hypothetical protein
VSKKRRKPSLFDLGVKVRCPGCQSILDVIETSSGGRTVSVSFLGARVETTALSARDLSPREHARFRDAASRAAAVAAAITDLLPAIRLA